MQEIRSELPKYAEKTAVEALQTTVEQNKNAADAQLAEVSCALADAAQDVHAIQSELPKYAEKSAVGDSIAEIRSQAAINRGSIGLQSKNLLMHNCSSFERNGIKATINSDRSITINGTYNGASAFLLYWNMQTGADTNGGESGQYENNKKWFPTGKYILSGGAQGAGLQICMANEDNSNGTIIVNYSGNTEVTIDDNIKYVWTRIRIAAGSSFNNVTLYPMLRCADITDGTYEPYTPDLQTQINELKAQIAQLTASAALLPALEQAAVIPESQQEDDDVYTETDEA